MKLGLALSILAPAGLALAQRDPQNLRAVTSGSVMTAPTRCATLSSMALRPSFELEVALSSRELIVQLVTAFERGPMQLKRTRVPGGGIDAGAKDADHLLLTVPASQRHFWSPWLTIEVSPRGERAHVLAKFSPHPSVWTGFAFGYLTMIVVLAVSLVIAATTLMVPSGQLSSLWVSAGAALVTAGLWSASQIGQRLARPQMDELRGELDRALAAARGP